MNQVAYQIVIIALISVIITLMRRILHRWWPKFLHPSTIWPFIMGYYSLLNLTWEWFPYPVMVWAVAGIIVVIGQVVVGGELIYHRFGRFFWKLTIYYTVVIYLGSICYTFLG